MIRILLAANDHGVRSSLRHLLTDGVALAVVGEASTAEEAVTKASWLRPDVVLLDLDLRGGSALDACSVIRGGVAGVEVLILGTYDNPDVRGSALDAGAADYVLKERDLCHLRRAILCAGLGNEMAPTAGRGRPRRLASQLAS